MIKKKDVEFNVVGQRILAVRQSPTKTNLGTRTTVDRIELANGVHLVPCAYNCDQDGPQGDINITAKPERLADAAQREALASGLAPAVSARIVARLFAGRKGHGNGPCTKRVLNVEELRSLIEAVYDLGVDAGRCMHPPAKADAAEKLSADPIAWDGYEGFNPEFTGYTAAPYSTGQPERGWCLFTNNGCWQQRTRPSMPPVPGATPVRRKGAWRWLLP